VASYGADFFQAANGKRNQSARVIVLYGFISFFIFAAVNSPLQQHLGHSCRITKVGVGLIHAAVVQVQGVSIG
jgi:hypothetical protein